jgi:hypothetical protein
MEIDGKKIEPKIANLVSLLNKVHYLETVSSCEGHFPKKIELDNGSYIEVDEYAHVIFEIPEKNEHDFEKLIYNLQSQTCLDWCEYNLSINKEYYCMPHEEELFKKWQLKIKPFMPANYSNQEKRDITHKAIYKLEDILENYLS